MIIAGIDEAGLGPALGPLAVCCSAFRLPAGSNAASGWEIFSGIAASSKKDKSAPLLVADSKIAYNSRGISGLETAFYSFLLSMEISCESLVDFLEGHGSADFAEKIPNIPWYKDALWPFPATVDAGNCADIAGKIILADAETLTLRVRLLSAAMLNRLFSKGLNKSEALLLQSGEHIRFLRENFPGEEIHIYLDKQGGRNFYAPFLSDIFCGGWVKTIRESAELSEYEVEGMYINIAPKQDLTSFPTALASIIAKYLRERCMENFNNFFAQHLPGLTPTAGYHGDAPQFMEKIAQVLKKLEIPREKIWRKR